MGVLGRDTSAVVTGIVLTGYRAMSPVEKLARMADLSASMRELSAARIRREDPSLNDREVGLRVAALLYSPDLMRSAFGWTAGGRNR